MISDTALQEFKKIYREEYGQDISNEKAMELAVNLLVLYKQIYHPLKNTEITKSISQN